MVWPGTALPCPVQGQGAHTRREEVLQLTPSTKKDFLLFLSRLKHGCCNSLSDMSGAASSGPGAGTLGRAMQGTGDAQTCFAPLPSLGMEMGCAG